MKKITSRFLTVSAILAISAMAPNAIWHAANTNRVPASLEEDRLEELALKIDNKIAAVPVVEVTCSNESQEVSLEEQIKKLVADKETILKELAELKKAKKAEEKDEKVELPKKEEVKVVAKTQSEDVLGFMSQITSLMISQQQQQTLILTQMFSMMQNQQPKQASNWYSPLSDYMSPYAFNASSFHYPEHKSIYSLSGMDNSIGLKANYDRAPSSLQEIFPDFKRGYFESEGSFTPKAQIAMPHNGYDFRNNTEPLEMRKIQF
jgi:hypothetical protein